MIKKTLVDNLIGYEKNAFPVTSAYICIENNPKDRKTHLVKLKKMFKYKKDKSYFKQLSENEQNSVLSDFSRIEQYFTDEFDPSKYVSTICFSCSHSGLWKIINLKQKIANELVIQPQPYIRPLTSFFSKHRDYGVILVDRAKARIFESKYGEFIEHWSIEEENIENRKTGGYQGTEERKIERNQQNIVANHYKLVAQKCFELNNKNSINWYILGGRKDVVKEFRNYLHNYIGSKIDGVIEVEPNTPLNNVLAKITETEKKARSRFEENLVTELQTKNQYKLSVNGIKDVIQVLENKQVSTIVIKDKYLLKGVFCRKDDFLGINSEKICPKCGSKLEKTNDIIEQILHNALAQSVDIQYITNGVKTENISALLRYAQKV